MRACTDGDIVQVFVDGVASGSALTCLDGYALAVPGVAEGSRTFAASVARGGLESERSGTLIVLVDRTPPAAPIVLTTAGVVGPNLTLQGSGEAQASVEVIVDGVAQCTAVADTNGQWQCALTLASGSHVIAARQTDLAGNGGPASAAGTFTVDRLFASGFEP